MSDLLHRPRACATCPFRRNSPPDKCFAPETLDETVGENLRGQQYAHRCHTRRDSDPEYVCVGFLMHVRAHDIPSGMTQVGSRLGVIDYDQITQDPEELCKTWEEILELHRSRAYGPQTR